MRVRSTQLPIAGKELLRLARLLAGAAFICEREMNTLGHASDTTPCGDDETRLCRSAGIESKF
jgi:hypothetical protein